MSTKRHRANLKKLLTLTAAIETGAGLAFFVWPSVTVSLLLGTALDTPAAFLIGRLAGVALVTLGVACWLARLDGQSRAAKGLVTAMLIYNLAACSILAFAGLTSGSNRVLLWAAVGLHATMTVWCMAALTCKQTRLATK